MARANRWSIEHFIFREYATSTSAQGIYRILFAACILFVYLPDHLWIPTFPDSFFNPPIGPTALFWKGFPNAHFFQALNALEVSTTIFLLAGFRTRIASLGLAFFLFVGNCWAFSFGKINHDILMILVPLVMAFSNWGTAYSIDGQKAKGDLSDSAWPLALLALITALGMMSAAEPKVVSGWLDLQSRAVLGHLSNNIIVTGRSNWLASQMLHIHSGAFWKFLDYSTVLVEASFLFLVGSRNTFRFACAAACVFHLGIALSMQIAYWPNLLAYGAFCDWSVAETWPVGRRLFQLWEKMLERISFSWLCCMSVAVSLLYLSVGNPLHRLAGVAPPDTDPLGTAVCLFAVIVSAIAAIHRRRPTFAVRKAGDAIVFFDGLCALCNGWVDLILRFDRRGTYRFSPLQSAAGREILKEFETQEQCGDSLVLLKDGRVYCRSTAIIKILAGLGFPFSVALISVAVPRRVRDSAYDFVARHRIGWFGAREACRVPSQEELSRFL